MKSLDELRKEIDLLDEELLQLLAKRLFVVKQIGEIKKTNGLPALDEKRRDELLQKIKQKGKKLSIAEPFIEKLYRTIHDHAVEVEQKG